MQSKFGQSDLLLSAFYVVSKRAKQRNDMRRDVYTNIIASKRRLPNQCLYLLFSH